MRVLAAVGLLLIGGGPVIRAGQERPEARAPQAHHVSVSGGIVWTGGYEIGEMTAQLRGNAVGPTAPPFVLFRADSSVDAAVGVDGRVGFALTREVTIEVGVSYQRPGLTTELTGDTEASSTTIDAQHLSQYIVDVGALWQLPGAGLGARVRPFALGGVGYLRQLYDERTMVETGRVYYAGGGVRYWLRGGDGRQRAVGLRADARAMWRLDGVEFQDRTRVMPVVTLHLFTEF